MIDIWYLKNINNGVDNNLFQININICSVNELIVANLLTIKFNSIKLTL